MTLMLVAIALCAATWGLRRHLCRRWTPPGDLEIVSRAGLSQRAGLALVSLSGRRLLIGYGEGAPVLLFDEEAGAPGRVVSTRPAFANPRQDEDPQPNRACSARPDEAPATIGPERLVASVAHSADSAAPAEQPARTH